MSKNTTHDIERRDFFAGIAGGASFALAGATLGAREAQANWGLIAPGPSPAVDFDGRSLVNKPRAYEVMEQEGVDGIVALNPVNVFYLGNYFSYEVQKLRAIPSFAVMPRDPAKPSFLVVASTDLWFIANAQREYPEVIPYSAPTAWEQYRDPDTWNREPAAAGGFRRPVREDSLTDIERGWVEMERRFENRKAATPEWALVRALEEAGLAKGRVAVDDMRIAHVLGSLGQHSVTCVPGDNTFRKIRMIKSDVELAHMRVAARANQDACMAMLRKVEAGMTKADVDQLFLEESATRGAKAIWIAVGTIGGFADGEVVPGRPMMVDAVSQINYYHGDFGRTWCLGEPRKDVLDRVAILRTGYEAALEALRPGLKYSEIRAHAADAMAKANKALTRAVFGASPHSVGLQHTDQPYRDGLPFMVSDDLVFQENMTLTVDMPSLEIGWGGAHLEDLIVVTKNGFEPLATMDDPLVVL
ncbi:M24 family metallopeptidase [Candidatus Foliamicus sp.]